MNQLLNNKKQWGDYEEYDDYNSNLTVPNIQVQVNEIESNSDNNSDSNNESNKQSEQLNQVKPNKYNKKEVLGGK